MATRTNQVSTDNAAAQEVLELRFDTMVPNDESAIFDTSGFDSATIVIGAGTRPTSGTTTYKLAATEDLAGTTANFVPEEAGYHKAANVGNGASSYNAGYILNLPRYLKLVANSGTGGSLSVHVFLRKVRTMDRGR